MLTLHERRAANEVELLQRTVALNPQILRLTATALTQDRSQIDFELLASPALVLEGGIPEVARTHRGQIRLPRFFPAVPIEIYLQRPVFHPNVDPGNGFVCLWEHYSADYTCCEAIRRLRLILAWKMMNPDEVQVIQPAALAWYRDPNRHPEAPLELEELRVPETEGYYVANRSPLGKRRRILDD